MKISLLSQATIALLASTALFIPTSFAADYTVTGATTVRNGDAATIIDGDDSLTILGGASIFVSTTEAVRAMGTNNTIANHGEISTTGDFDAGVWGLLNSNFTNTGTITTTGADALGVSVFENSSVDNSGSISTTEDGSHAIGALGNTNIIDSSGTLATLGDNANGIFTFDGNTITNSGTISTAGFRAVAIEAQSDNNVSNSGSIATTGNGGHGISARDDNSVGNSGEISVEDDESFGIFVHDTNVVSNSGTIEASGGESYAILGGDNNNVTNSGSISTLGDDVIGIVLADDNIVLNTGTITTTGNSILVRRYNLVTNQGTITTSDFNAWGIKGTRGNELVNSGTIQTTGEQAEAIYMADRLNTLTNTGKITASGVDAIAVYFEDHNIFTHSGTLISEQSFSLVFDGTGNTLNLEGAAFIAGEMSLGDATTVNINTDGMGSVLWDFSTYTSVPTMTISGDVPWVWNATTEQFSTFDATAISAASDLLADNVGVLSELARTNNLPGEWWLKGYGSFGETTGTGSYAHLSGGIATGASFVLNKNFDLGAFAGYQVSDLIVGGKSTISNGIVGGIYSTYATDDWFVDLALYAGFMGGSSDRLINDNLAPLGVAHALADYNSFFLAPEIRVGVNVDTGGGWTLTPSASSRFSNQWIDGYTETGSNANATVGARFVQVIEGELELAATRDLDAGELTIRGGIDYLQNLGAATQDVILQGQTLAIPVGNGGTFGGYVGVDFNYNLSDNMTLDLSAKTGLSANGYAVSGSIGVSGLF